MRLELPEQRIIGPTGELVFPDDDQISRRFCMLLEGQCEGLGTVVGWHAHVFVGMFASPWS